MTYGEADSYQGAPQVGYQRPDVNESARYAAQHGEDDHGVFSSVLTNMLDRDDDDHKRPMEDHEVTQAADAHDRIYNQGGHEGASSRDMGSAAAMQAFKMFSSSKGSGGGGSSELIGLAMGEAMKLYKSSAGGGGGGGNQAEMLQSAAGMAMKLLASQNGGSSGGSGGLGAVMGLLGQSGKSGGGGGGAASLISKFL
ncbi:hypothetical protein BCR42DRAFT_403764 [Absidia repens]|uniref:DUF7721 domain-containing protein n=1 Tax=Absidia repens TaxID=90262 RepID=A0A1X2IVB0_9FUNG|nr:hypothetical protein BCR42DRAFT_403764 [Absidia repens]